MPPKKAKKIALSEFLGDSGSWADEMDSLPSAPAVRTDDDNQRSNDRYGRRDDFQRPERTMGPPRDDVPLPTQPPFTAFVGNLSFDLLESDLAAFFEPLKTKSIKIIKDRDDKPKGFGYVEFVDLDGLKEALEKSGSNFSGRTVRVSVAEPPKERHGFGGGGDEDSKFDSSWRRDGPLPDHGREGSRRRYDSSDRSAAPSGVSDGVDGWRSNRPLRTTAPEPEQPSFKRKNSGFATPEVSAADKEEVWTIGGKFKASTPVEDPPSRFGSTRSREGPPRDTSAAEEHDWRAARPKVPRSNISPTTSTPPTPQVARKKLELLPRTGTGSATPSPLSSPKMGPTPSSSGSKPNPFGGARPADTFSREREVAERVERDREAVRERASMSRTSSRTGTERPPIHRPRTPPSTGSPPAQQSPRAAAAPKVTHVPNVRPSLSFAAAAKRENAERGNSLDEGQNGSVEQVADSIAEVTI